MDSRFRGNDKEKKNRQRKKEKEWIPAFAGMTWEKISVYQCSSVVRCFCCFCFY